MSKTAFLFSGQGTQKIGMGKELYNHFSIARQVIDELDEVFEGKVKKIAFDGSQEDLDRTLNAQVCIYAVEAAMFEVITKEKNIRPDFLAGFSLGEYSALMASGALDKIEVARLLVQRSALMHEAAMQSAGGMAALIGMDKEVIADVISEIPHYIEMVNFNCPGQIVVAGDVEGIDAIVDAVAQRKLGRARKLQVSGAFHSKHMDAAAIEYKKYIDGFTFKEPVIPILSNVTAKPMAANEMKQLLAGQMHMPVKWEESVMYLIGQQVDKFIEIGIGSVLLGFMKKIDNTKERVHFDEFI